MDNNWFRSRFPKVPLTEEVGLIKGKAWGMFSKAGVTISDIAAEGTVYHEAMHVALALFHTQEEKQAVLSDARKYYILKGTDLEVEEHLAEEYRAYEILQQEEGLPASIKRFFSNLYHTIKNFIKGDRAGKNTRDLFKKIGTGYYKDANQKVRLDNIQDAKFLLYLENDNIHDISIKRATSFVIDVLINANLRDTKYLMSKTSFLNKIGKIFTNKEIENLAQYYINSSTEFDGFNDNNKEIIKKAIVAEAINSFKIAGIPVENYIDGESVEQTQDITVLEGNGIENAEDASAKIIESFGVADNEKNPYDRISAPIRLMILSLRSEDSNVNKASINNYDHTKFNENLSRLIYLLKDARSLEEMMEKLRSIPDHSKNKALANDFISRIEAIDTISNVNAKVRLKALVARTFGLSTMGSESIIYKEEEKDVIISDSNKDSSNKRIEKDFENSLKELEANVLQLVTVSDEATPEQKALFVNYNKKQIEDKIFSQLKQASYLINKITINDNNRNITLTDSDVSTLQITLMYLFLDYNKFDLKDMTYRDLEAIQEKVKYIAQTVKFKFDDNVVEKDEALLTKRNFYKAIYEGKASITNLFFSNKNLVSSVLGKTSYKIKDNRIGVRKDLNVITSILLKYSNDTPIISSSTIEGKSKWIVVYPSLASKAINMLNKAQHIEELLSVMPNLSRYHIVQRLNGNSHKYAILNPIIESIFDADGNRRVSAPTYTYSSAEGLTNNNDSSIPTSSLSVSERIFQYVVNTVNSHFTFYRTSDKKTEPSIIVKEGFNKKIYDDPEKAINELGKYVFNSLTVETRYAFETAENTEGTLKFNSTIDTHNLAELSRLMIKAYGNTSDKDKPKYRLLNAVVGKVIRDTAKVPQEQVEQQRNQILSNILSRLIVNHSDNVGESNKIDTFGLSDAIGRAGIYIRKDPFAVKQYLQNMGLDIFMTDQFMKNNLEKDDYNKIQTYLNRENNKIKFFTGEIMSFIMRNASLDYIAGPLHTYKSQDDMFKRLAGVVGTKSNLYTNDPTDMFNPSVGANAEINASLTEEERKVYSTDGTFSVLILKDKLAQDNPERIEALEELSSYMNKPEDLNYLKESNTADAQTYANPYFYREYMMRDGQWSGKHEKLFREVMSGKSINYADYTDISFKPIKIMYCDQGLYIKTCMIPLFPNFNNGEKLDTLAKAMLKNNIGIFGFESAFKKLNKNHKVWDIDEIKEDQSISRTNIKDIDSAENYGKKLDTTIGNFYFIGTQLESSNSIKETIVDATQIKFQAFSDVFYTGKYGNEGEELFKDKLRKISEANKELLGIKFTNLLESLGFSPITQRIEDKNKLINTLKQTLSARDIDHNTISEMEKLINKYFENRENDDNASMQLDTLPLRDKIEYFIQSIGNKRLFKYKRKGGSKIAQTGYGHGLKFYSINEDGKTLNGIEVKMVCPCKDDEGIPFRTKDAMIRYEKNKLHPASFANEDELLKEAKKIVDKKLTLIGYRIPTQDMASIDLISIKEFIDPIFGDTIIVPEELPAKVGMDFGFDKLNLFYREKGNTREEILLNIILDTYIEILSDIRSLPTLLRATSTDHLKRLAEEIKTRNKVQEFTIINPQMNIMISNTYMGTKKCIGIGATNFIGHTMSMMRFSSKGENYIDHDNRSISNILSQFQSAAIDTAKYPILSYFNITDKTFGGLLAGIRLGIPYEFIIEVYVQNKGRTVVPILRKYSDSILLKYLSKNNHATSLEIYNALDKFIVSNISNANTGGKKAKVLYEMLSSNRKSTPVNVTYKTFSYGKEQTNIVYIPLNKLVEDLYIKLNTQDNKEFKSFSLYNNAYTRGITKCYLETYHDTNKLVDPKSMKEILGIDFKPFYEDYTILLKRYQEIIFKCNLWNSYHSNNIKKLYSVFKVLNTSLKVNNMETINIVDSAMTANLICYVRKSENPKDHHLVSPESKLTEEYLTNYRYVEKLLYKPNNFINLSLLEYIVIKITSIRNTQTLTRINIDGQEISILSNLKIVNTNFTKFRFDREDLDSIKESIESMIYSNDEKVRDFAFAIINQQLLQHGFGNRYGSLIKFFSRQQIIDAVTWGRDKGIYCISKDKSVESTIFQYSVNPYYTYFYYILRNGGSLERLKTIIDEDKTKKIAPYLNKNYSNNAFGIIAYSYEIYKIITEFYKDEQSKNININEEK